MWVPSLGREDPLEKEMATFSSTLAWRIPWTEEPGGLQSMGSQESDMTERLNNENNTPPPHPLHTHSRMKFFHLQHHGWTRRALCLVK